MLHHVVVVAKSKAVKAACAGQRRRCTKRTIIPLRAQKAVRGVESVMKGWGGMCKNCSKKPLFSSTIVSPLWGAGPSTNKKKIPPNSDLT